MEPHTPDVAPETTTLCKLGGEDLGQTGGSACLLNVRPPHFDTGSRLTRLTLSP